MSQLIWRPIEAPRFDMQGLAQNAAGITNSFDRFGQTLINKEESLRTEATDAAIAEAMALQDPEQVKQRLMAGAGGLGKRVNARDFMTALGTHQNQLMDTSLKNEEMLNAKAYAELGDEGAALLNAATKGDRGAMDQVMALAAENPLWARVAQPFMKDASGAFDQADTRGITRTRDANNHQVALGGLANDRARVGIAQQELGMRRQEHALRLAGMQRAEQDRVAAEKAYGWGTRFAGALDPSYAPEDALTILKKSERWKNAKPGEREVLEGSVNAAYGARTSATDEALNEAPSVAGGMPSYLTPNAQGRGATYLGLDTSASGAKAQAKVANTAMTQSFLGENPYLAVFKNNQGRKEEASFDDVVRYFESNTGIHEPAEDIRRIQKREHLTNNEVIALAETFGFKDKPWHTGVDSFWSGTTDFEKRAAEYREKRDAGDIDKTAVELGAKTSPLTTVQSQLDRALAKAKRQTGANGRISPTTAREVQELQAELRRLSTTPR